MSLPFHGPACFPHPVNDTQHYYKALETRLKSPYEDKLKSYKVMYSDCGTILSRYSRKENRRERYVLALQLEALIIV